MPESSTVAGTGEPYHCLPAMIGVGATAAPFRRHYRPKTRMRVLRGHLLGAPSGQMVGWRPGQRRSTKDA